MNVLIKQKKDNGKLLSGERLRDKGRYLMVHTDRLAVIISTLSPKNDR